MKMEIGKNVRYAIGGLALALLVSCNNAGSFDDTKINSFYNTYKYTGLPLGPISNPGIDSISPHNLR